jgi:hypothetical protein
MARRIFVQNSTYDEVAITIANVSVFFGNNLVDSEPISILRQARSQGEMYIHSFQEFNALMADVLPHIYFKAQDSQSVHCVECFPMMVDIIDLGDGGCCPSYVYYGSNYKLHGILALLHDSKSDMGLRVNGLIALIGRNFRDIKSVRDWYVKNGCQPVDAFIRSYLLAVETVRNERLTRVKATA